MDNQKVEQVLKEIFDRYGVEVVNNRARFKAAIFDLLDERNYRNERIVLGHAMESDAIRILLSTASITGDTVNKAVEQLENESHMKGEDAEFIVRCVIAACGENPALVMTGGIRWAEEKKRRERQEEEKKRQENEKRWKEEEQKRQEDANEKKLAVIAVAICAVLSVVIIGLFVMML